MNEFISEKDFLTWGRLKIIRLERRGSLLAQQRLACALSMLYWKVLNHSTKKNYWNFESVVEYLAKIWIHIAYTSFWIPAYSIPAPLLYMLIDMACFFGCQQFSFAATITLRILCILHDFSYGVTNAVLTDYYSGRNDCGYGCDPGRSPNIKLMVIQDRLLGSFFKQEW